MDSAEKGAGSYESTAALPAEGERLRALCWRLAQVAGCACFVIYSIPLFVLAPVGFISRSLRCWAGDAVVSCEQYKHSQYLAASFGVMLTIGLGSLLIVWLRARSRGIDITAEKGEGHDALQPQVSDAYMELQAPSNYTPPGLASQNW
eukprot:TRINITY_DN63873_c0_g1_i1.p1 TRINITY_DN63873_c0_g1~~TRINITY_DN63873_c0_g1_i1.p1  ORF type:complete len:163 (-),score=31.51 TRINITY_DN63873_c0_g1_i1:147-590(-)